MDYNSSDVLARVRNFVQQLPGVEEYICFGTPAFRVKKRLLSRLKEDGETMAVHADDRDDWTGKDPVVFFVTDHYRNYPMVLVNLLKVSDEDLQQLLLEAWKQIAPKRMVKSYELTFNF